MTDVSEAREEELPHVRRIFNEAGFCFLPMAVFRESLKKGGLLVAKEEGQVIGFAYFHHGKQGVTRLYDIVITQTRQRRGVGRKLIEEVTKQAAGRGQKKLVLRCPVDLPANRFYAALGFQPGPSETNKRNRLILSWEKEMP